jgi:hypothetical protein
MWKILCKYFSSFQSTPKDINFFLTIIYYNFQKIILLCHVSEIVQYAGPKFHANILIFKLYTLEKIV